MASSLKIAIVGSGPAGLMAATELLRAHATGPRPEIHLFERRAGLGRKLLIAGSSGLNISHELSEKDFAAHYEGWDESFWLKLFKHYGVKNWIQFIEKDLGLETFLGTSSRYFVREMKASGLLKLWTEYLGKQGVRIHLNSELADFKSGENFVELKFKNSAGDLGPGLIYQKAVFALGGASWETSEPSWADLFRSKNLGVVPFEASNVGYEVNWKPKFLSESEGKPLKKVSVKTARGKKLGELVVTSYGLEGTPIYFTGTVGEAFLDLKPDLSESEIFQKLSQSKENLSPMRRVKHLLALSEAAESLLFHESTAADKADLKQLIKLLKKLPLMLTKARPLSESISSRGGVALTELSDSFELKSFPGIYCGGEMLAWDAPTGGFLIQASISQGAYIGSLIGKK